MDEKEKEKTCKNCSYYCGYYFKFKNYIKSAGCGNCLNNHTHYKKRYRKDDEICERFKPYETKPTERTESIENVIGNMQRQLSQILIILKAE